MKRLILLLALALTACEKNKIYNVDPAIQPYVDRFTRASNEVDHPIVVDNLVANIKTLSNPQWAGQCDINNETPTVSLSAAWWPTFNDSMREQLVFHELGHCVLGRQHNNDVDQYGVPVSIMYGQMSWESIYLVHRADWFIELFWYGGNGQDNLNPGTVIN